MSSASFTQLRNQAIGLETSTQQLLGRLSKLQQSTPVAAEPEEVSVAAEIATALAARDDIVAKMGRASETDNTLSTSRLQQLQRHRETLAADRAAHAKIVARARDERARNNLLSSVQRDISAHKQRHVAQSQSQAQSAEAANAYILEEGRRVDSAMSFAERLLQQAYETRDELLGQRAMLQGASSRVQGTLSAIPGLGVLISKINTRRRRDTMIMATVIALCILALYFLA